ncbi:MAG: hypothetical protein FJX95_01095 [Bacteroidetes bacterium]|nr:hypothetical protein [Bacteroidota bacterium]
MKNAILLITLLLANMVFSQTKTDNKPEDPKQRKIEKVNKALALTDEETAKFWPLHDNFDSQQENLRLQLKKAQSDLKIAKGKKEFNKAFEEVNRLKIEMIKKHEQYIKNCYDFLGEDRTKILLDLEKKQKRHKVKKNDETQKRGRKAKRNYRNKKEKK